MDARLLRRCHPVDHGGVYYGLDNQQKCIIFFLIVTFVPFVIKKRLDKVGQAYYDI